MPEWSPQEADFNGDTVAYERALNAHSVRQAAREAIQQEVAREHVERLHTREAEAHREHVVAHLDRVEELKERVPDFSDAMKVAATIQLREEVLDEILRSEKSALVQYYLAKNPERARELNGLGGRELSRAVGRLEGAVRLPTKRATGATPPVQPLTGASGRRSIRSARRWPPTRPTTARRERAGAESARGRGTPSPTLPPSGASKPAGAADPLPTSPASGRRMNKDNP